MMERYQVILAYDGSEFMGFQRQARARTVQGVVENALRRLGWQGKSLLAAGRTDAGVHASGQVIAFDLEWNHPEEDLRNALNAGLPADVAARAVQKAPADFHPRYDARLRTYRYRLFCDEVRQPLRERFAWRVWPPVNPDRLRQASALLEGKHDFAAFGTPPRPSSSTVRTVFHTSWQQDGDELVFEISAEAFLYHMVRRLVAAQVEAAQGRIEVEWISAALSGRQGLAQVGLAPACGLALIEVRYNLEERISTKNLGDRESTRA
jgi:tRNA pseudouridine38-40 synthase